jgi:hypothetical protein
VTPSRHDEEAARRAREVAARAIRRLDILEWIILGVAALVAVGGGWLVAVVLATAVRLPFGLVWTLAALLLIGVPTAVTLRKVRSEELERERRRRSERSWVKRNG